MTVPEGLYFVILMAVQIIICILHPPLISSSSAKHHQQALIYQAHCLLEVTSFASRLVCLWIISRQILRNHSGSASLQKILKKGFRLESKLVHNCYNQLSLPMVTFCNPPPKANNIPQSITWRFPTGFFPILAVCSSL